MKIYVGNLPKTATEESIRQKFQEYGEVTEVKLIKDNYTHELRGFGFVEMPSKSVGESAIKGLNGADLEGNKLIVNEARPREKRSDGRRGGGGGGRGGGGYNRGWSHP
ncbi:RNA-binding protein [bacterium]|nr:RNA-binding protein [bacterium]